MSAYFVDALRNEEPENDYQRSYANSQDGEGAVINFAWMTEVPDWAYTNYGDPSDSFEPLRAAARDVVREAMAQFSAVANIRWVATSEAEANTLFGSWSMPQDGGAAAYATYPAFNLISGEFAFPSEVMFSTNVGVYALIALHEIGHTLGLEHPHEGSSVLPKDERLHANTVMAYAPDSTAKLGLFDKIALQSIYGPAERRTGDDTYVFGQGKLIWDGGGHDLIDASGAAQRVTLKLGDGTWSHAGSRSSSLLDPEQVWIGHFSILEDARGSRFRDTITGNEGQNAIWGRGADDLIKGFDGVDSLHGGKGGDALYGGRGADRLMGGDGADRLFGDTGVDLLNGGGGADLFVFTGKGSAGSGARADVILDLGARDRIDLSALDLQLLDQDAFTGAGHELRIQSLADQTLLLADIDGDGTAEFEIALKGVIGIAQDQLIL